jgi:hypothetical protein
MSINEDHASITENTTPSVSPGNYSPVTVTMEDTVGTMFLGILASILLIGWMRAEARYRELRTKYETLNG